MKFFSNSHIIKLILISSIFFLDRISKVSVLNFFENTQLQELIISNFLSIYLIWNEGIAFGLLNFDDKLIYNLISIIIIIISIIIFVFALKNRDHTGYFFSSFFLSIKSSSKIRQITPRVINISATLKINQ